MGGDDRLGHDGRLPVTRRAAILIARALLAGCDPGHDVVFPMEAAS